MGLEHLGERIERVMREARFPNVWGQSFDASVMHELCARKRHHEYRVTGAEAISVGEGERASLVAEIAPMLAPYRASNTGPVGNGLYRLMGDSASPRLPSVEDYARILVPCIGPCRAGARRRNVWGLGRRATHPDLAVLPAQGRDQRGTVVAQGRARPGNAAREW